MATRISKRHMEQRARTYDRITTTIDKGGANLLKALALRENVSQAELLRRALLARAGLHLLPFPDDLAELATVKDQNDARRMIRKFQNREMGQEIIQRLIDELAPEPPAAAYVVQMDDADVHDVSQTLKKITEALATPGPLELSGRDVGILRRLLANIEQMK